MNCDETQQRLAAYLGRELDPSTREAVEAHLASCPACRADAEALTEVIRSVADLPVEEPPRGFSDAVMARVRGESRPASLWKRLFLPPWTTLPAYATACVVVAVGVGWYVIRATQPVPVQVAQQTEDRAESQRETESVAIPEAAPAPKREPAPAETNPEFVSKSAKALTEPRSSASDSAQTPASPPALEAPAARQDLQSEPAGAMAIAPSGPKTEADREFTVTFYEPRGDEKMLARLRAAVERAGGSPMPAAANTVDSLWLTINADHLDVLQQELQQLPPFSPDRPGEGDGPAASTHSPPTPPEVPFRAQGSKETEETHPRVRVKVVIQWALPTTK